MGLTMAGACAKHRPCYWFQTEGELRTQCKVFKILHINVGNYWRAGETHGSTMKLFKELVLEGKDSSPRLILGVALPHLF